MRRTPRYSTRNLMLTYLRVLPGPRPTARIIQYMVQMHHVNAGATRAQLYRLVRAGKIERVGEHWYQLAAGA